MRPFFLVAALVLATPAFAEPAPPIADAPPAAATPVDPAPPAPPKAKPEKPEMVCRREAATGSIMTRRVCRTREQMAKDEAEAKALEERLTQSNSLLRGN